MTMIRRNWLLLATAVVILPAVGSSARPAAAGDTDPDEILRRADDVRNPAESFFLKVKVTSSSAPETDLEVAIAGKNRTLITTLKPMRDRGRKALMVNEDMWAYLPNLKKGVRVGLSQRMVGQAANGDISRTRWAGDYSPVVEKQSDKTWTMLLTANKSNLTYAKIRVVIEKGSFHPLKAEFLTPAGKALKRAEFRSYKTICDKDRPSEMHIQDALKPGEFSDIKIVEMKVQTFSASMFYPENLQ